MIFSHPTLAKFLSDRFECAWKSVRPAPKVTIEFGNGRRLVRTINGNVATYFCDAQGRTFDLLPGLVSPHEFARRAAQALALFHGKRPDVKELLASLKTVAPQLDKDTAFNKAHRYALAWRILAKQPLAKPSALRDRVYKEVLGTDLQDPYLGLAPRTLGGSVGRF